MQILFIVPRREMTMCVWVGGVCTHVHISTSFSFNFNKNRKSQRLGKIYMHIPRLSKGI